MERGSVKFLRAVHGIPPGVPHDTPPEIPPGVPPDEPSDVPPEMPGVDPPDYPPNTISA